MWCCRKASDLYCHSSIIAASVMYAAFLMALMPRFQWTAAHERWWYTARIIDCRLLAHTSSDTATGVRCRCKKTVSGNSARNPVPILTLLYFCVSSQIVWHAMLLLVVWWLVGFWIIEWIDLRFLNLSKQLRTRAGELYRYVCNPLSAYLWLDLQPVDIKSRWKHKWKSAQVVNLT